MTSNAQRCGLGYERNETRVRSVSLPARDLACLSSITAFISFCAAPRRDILAFGGVLRSKSTLQSASLIERDESPAQKPLGLRERSRMETQDRIIVTARRLLAEQGYDATTTRKVAIGAGLGVGTLFNYVKDKRDLIYLIFNKDVRTMTAASLAAPRPWETFEEKILSVFEYHYRFFGSEPVLSRILLTETVQHEPGFHLNEFLSVRAAIIDGIEKLVAEAQASGEINRRRILQLSHDIFSLCIRRMFDGGFTVPLIPNGGLV